MKIDEHEKLKSGNAEPCARYKRRHVPGRRMGDTYDFGLSRRSLRVQTSKGLSWKANMMINTINTPICGSSVPGIRLLFVQWVVRLAVMSTWYPD